MSYTMSCPPSLRVMRAAGSLRASSECCGGHQHQPLNGAKPGQRVLLLILHTETHHVMGVQEHKSKMTFLPGIPWGREERVIFDCA